MNKILQQNAASAQASKAQVSKATEEDKQDEIHSEWLAASAIFHQEGTPQALTVPDKVPDENQGRKVR